MLFGPLVTVAVLAGFPASGQSQDLAGSPAEVAALACPEAFAAVQQVWPASGTTNIWSGSASEPFPPEVQLSDAQRAASARLGATYGLIDASAYSFAVGPADDAQRAARHALWLAHSVELFDCLELDDAELAAFPADLASELSGAGGEIGCIVDAARRVNSEIDEVATPELVRELVAEVYETTFQPCEEALQ